VLAAEERKEGCSFDERAFNGFPEGSCCGLNAHRVTTKPEPFPTPFLIQHPLIFYFVLKIFNSRISVHRLEYTNLKPLVIYTYTKSCMLPIKIRNITFL
jgi:hypothetical protein